MISKPGAALLKSQSWKIMAQTIAHLSPSTSKDILHLNFWWTIEYQGLYFGNTIDIAHMLYHQGLRHFRNIWDFLEWEEAREKFSFAKVYFDFWVNCWSSMDPLVIGCLAKTMLNSHHKNGLACLETWRSHYQNGLFVLVISWIFT